MVRTRFCVSCGRELREGENIGPYCLDCYIENIGVFREKPRVEVTQCPKCGSWYFRGVWHEPGEERAIVKTILESEQKRFLRENISVVGLDLENHPEGLGQGYIGHFRLLIDGRHVAEVSEEVRVSRVKKLCPRCFASSAGTHKALIQIRFEGRRPSEDLVEELLSYVLTVASRGVVDYEETKDGVDIKLEDAVLARKLSKQMATKYGAYVKESFSTARYDSQHGKWVGVATFSVRIPVFELGELVEYKGSYYVVRGVENGHVIAEDPARGVVEEIPVSKYWEQEIKRVEEAHYGSKTYIVIGVDKHSVYLLDEQTGEVLEKPLSPGYAKLNIGDKVYLITVGENELIVRGD